MTKSAPPTSSPTSKRTKFIVGSSFMILLVIAITESYVLQKTNRRLTSLLSSLDSIDEKKEEYEWLSVPYDGNPWVETDMCHSSEGTYYPACHHVTLVQEQKLTFCAAAKTASTTFHDYFFKISGRDPAILKDKEYGVHEVFDRRLGDLTDDDSRRELFNGQWTHIFFMRHVVERFVSGYLDKVVHDCGRDYNPRHAIRFYDQFGFSCDDHGSDFESFVSFMESVPRMEGHFAPQTPLCNIGEFPFTKFIYIDHNLVTELEALSEWLGVHHPSSDSKTRSHGTGAADKMRDVIKSKELLARVLAIFKEDCEKVPKACDVAELMAVLD